MSRRYLIEICISVALATWLGVSASNLPVYSEAPTAAQSKPRAAAPPDLIRIGFITSLSGVGEPGSRDMVNGTQLYLQQVHHKMAGRPVKLLIENDESNPAKAVAVAQKLVEQDKCQILDGLILSNIAYKTVPMADKYGVPFVLPITGADDLTKRKRAANVIRVSFAGSQPSHPFGEWVYKNLGYKKIAVLAADYPFGWESAAGFQRTFEDAGGQIVQKIWAPMGLFDFSDYIKKIRPDVDAVLLSFTNGGAVKITKQFRELRPKTPLLATGPCVDESILRDSGNEELGIVSAYMYSGVLNNAENKRFVSDYKQQFHEAPGLFAEGGYTSMMWIDKALQSINGKAEDEAAFAKALKSISTNTPRGPMKIDAYNNPIQNIYIRRVDRVGGKLQNTVIDTIPAVSQFWKYDPDKFMAEPPYGKDSPPCKHCTQ